jgi:hypothetical protein
LPMGVLMLPLLAITETSVRRRFMGSYQRENGPRLFMSGIKHQMP